MVLVLEKRWAVERTFAWLGLARGLWKDYEDYEMLPSMSEVTVLLASIRLVLRRLARLPDSFSVYRREFACVRVHEVVRPHPEHR